MTILQLTVSAGTTFDAGTSTITTTSTTAIANISATANAYTQNATFVISTASTSSRTFTGGGKAYGTFTYTVANSPGALVISTASNFSNLNIGSGRTLTLTSNNTINVANQPALNSAVNGYLYLPGLTGNYASAPDIAAYTGAGIIRCAIRVALDDWTPAASSSLMGHWTNTAQRGWMLDANTGGTLQFSVSADGAASTLTQASSAHSFVDGTAYWVGVEYDIGVGTLTFYKANDSASLPAFWAGWTQISTHALAAVTPFNSTQGLTIGIRGDGVTGPAAGKFYRALFYTSTTTLQYDADFSTHQINTSNWSDTPKTTFVEASANAATVTINGTLAQVGDGRIVLNATSGGSAATISKGYLDAYNNVFGYVGSSVVQNQDNVYLPGTSGNFIYTNDTPAVSITGDIDLRIKLALDDWTPGGTKTLIGKRAASSTNISYELRIDGAGRPTLTLSTDGTTAVATTSANPLGFTDGTTNWLRATWRQSDGRIQFFTADGSLSAPSGGDWVQFGIDQTNAIASIYDGIALLEIGSDLGGTSANAAGKFYQVQVLNGIDGTPVASWDAGTSGKQTLSYNYLSIKDSTASGRANWYAGTNSIDVSGNTAWTFTNPPTYLNGFFSMF